MARSTRRHTGAHGTGAGRLPSVASAVVDLDQPRCVRCFGVVNLSDYGFHALARRRPEVYAILAEPVRTPGDEPLDLTVAGVRHGRHDGGP